MQREQGGLGEEAGRHQRRRRPHGWLRADRRGQQRDVERAVSAIEQPGAEQIEHRAEQREQQITQGGSEGLGSPVKTNQRHAGEGQDFERDEQIEEIAADEDHVQSRPEPQQEHPEHERRARLGAIRRRAEALARKNPRGWHDQRRRHQHHCGESVRPQDNPERRRPSADIVDERLAGLPDVSRDRERDDQLERHQAKRDALWIASAERERSQDARAGQQDREHEQVPA